jgi:4-hydroxy-tetrahydrodipicolinate synthase
LAGRALADAFSPSGLPKWAAMRPYEGLLTAMVTPFRADGRVNEEAAVALGRHLLAHGSDGLVVCGTTGESPTLADDEAVSLVETMVDELAGEATIVAGAGSNDTRHAAHLAERMAETGAHALLSVTGYYNRPNRRGILRHYEEVARAAGGTPVIVYNIPSRTTLNLDPELLAELAQIDGIEAVKQSCSPDLGPIDGLTVLTGNDEDLARALDLGCAGGINVSSHIVGTEMRRMFDEPERRAEIDASLRDVYAAMFCTASPIPVKAALNLLGHDVGGLRLPLVEADDRELGIVRTSLERHGLLTGVHAG